MPSSTIRFQSFEMNANANDIFDEMISQLRNLQQEFDIVKQVNRNLSDQIIERDNIIADLRNQLSAANDLFTEARPIPSAPRKKWIVTRRIPDLDEITVNLSNAFEKASTFENGADDLRFNDDGTLDEGVSSTPPSRIPSHRKPNRVQMAEEFNVRRLGEPFTLLELQNIVDHNIKNSKNSKDAKDAKNVRKIKDAKLVKKAPAIREFQTMQTSSSSTQEILPKQFIAVPNSSVSDEGSYNKGINIRNREIETFGKDISESLRTLKNIVINMFFKKCTRVLRELDDFWNNDHGYFTITNYFNQIGAFFSDEEYETLVMVFEATV